jgi:hypothetical protein
MATINLKSGKVTDAPHGARVLPDERDSQTPAIDPNAPRDDLEGLREWVITRVKMWRDHRRSNYEQAWDQYERLWRGMWATEDKHRKSERSTLVTPGLAEAVENIVAEVEEALFGRGDSFDMKAKFDENEDAKQITDDNKAKLKEDLGRADFNPNVGEALINAAVYGSGIGEVIVEKFMLREISASVAAAYPPMPELGSQIPDLGMPTGQMGPMTPDMGPTPMDMAAPGMEWPANALAQPAMSLLAPTMQPGVGSAPLEAQVIEKEVSYACLYSVNPRNFLIDPTARTVDKALGVAIEEYVGAHIISKGQRDGDYRSVDVGTSAGDTELGADRQVENEYTFDKVHCIRYYGLVPKHLIFPPGETVDLSADPVLGEAEVPAVAEEMVDLDALGVDGAQKSVEPIDTEMVEAIVVIANESVCLKAVENPYLMKDRPVVAFPWDIVPGRFWGRGVCEKGQVPQRVMDAELRARIDALAYISAPMMAMDASRLPRGFQLTVRPGKSILTNGDPNTILRPMHFGQLEQSTFAHSQQLDQMIQRATGSLDVIALASKAGSGDPRSGATSMMLSGIVKRHKRTLMGFIDRFYVPALRKILWRNMQYYPERYVPRNWDFVASSTMGIIQREYETQNLVQLLNTMEPQSAEYKMLLMGVISNTGLTHRREIIDMLKKSIESAQQAQEMQQESAADPQMAALQQQITQAGAELQLAELQAKVAELNARANLQNAKARNEALEPGFRQVELATKGIYQVAADQQDRAFKSRMAVVDAKLKARAIDSDERITSMQSRASIASEAIKARGAAAAAKKAAAPAPAPQRVPVPVPVPVRMPPPRPQFMGRRGRLLA